MSRPAAATLGVFDGVHLGHRGLLDRTHAEAARLGGESIVFTFDPHPAAVLAPDRRPPLLSTIDERRRWILAAGIDRVEVLTFDQAMAGLMPEEFVDQFLLQRAAVAHLVIGHDFALGHGRVGDADRLTAIGAARGFGVTRLSAVRQDGEVVSSSRIRAAIRAGDLDRAAALLGRRYSLSGPVVTGAGRGRGLGFPTANVRVAPEKLLPPFGVYAVRVDPGGDGPAAGRHPGVMNHGRRPTFQGEEPSTEVHLLDFEGDLVGRTLTVELVARLRGERRFPGPEALAAQIGADVAAARKLLDRAGD